MGSTLDKPADNITTMSAEEFEALRADPTSGYVLSGCLVSTEILAYILSFVPKKYLVRRCRLVCRNWKQLLDDHVIWRNICDRLSIPVPHLNEELPENYYRTIAFTNLYGRNFIKNPCGVELLRHWEIESNGGDGWRREDPPNGADLLDTVEELKVAGITSCFATSYGECRKKQTIDLIQEGIPADILERLQPKIKVSEWYAGRFDCASKYMLEVNLLNRSHKVLDTFVFGPVSEPQWAGQTWHKVEHTFEKYKPGLRYIVFTHMGHDLQFWAGHYGSKMTAATVRFVSS